MSMAPAPRQLAAPRSAHTTRRGAVVQLIVLHSDPRPAAEALAAYTAPGSAEAPHYYVAADGALAQLVPEQRAARHSGQATWNRRRRSVDRVSVGIALEGRPGAPYAPAQLAALQQLAADVASRHGLGAAAVVVWQPPEPGEKAGALAPAYLPALLPRAPRRPAVLGAEEEEPAAVDKADQAPAVLGGEDQAQLWLELQEETFRRRGGIGFQPGWAFHLHAASQGLGAPLAPSSPQGRQVSVGGKRYGYQPFARDTIFNEGQQWTAVQNLSQVAGGAMPAAGSLGLLLLQQSYEDAIAAGPQPPAGKTAFQPGQAMPQFALRERLGPALSGNYAITVAGASYAVQVFAGDTLFTPVAPAGQATNWGVVKRLSQEPAGPLREALWVETYKVSGAPYQPGTPLQQTAEREKLGAPLSGVLAVRGLQVQVFALDTLYASPGQAPQRASALAKPAAVTGWKPAAPAAAPAAPRAATPAAPAQPAANFAPPPGDRASAAWPPAPGFRFLSTAEREKLFGKYAYTVRPDRNVTITDGWDKANIVEVPTPQLARFKVPSVKFHKLAGPQLQGLLAAWEQAGLLDRIISWDGTFVPRLMRKVDQLSAHAWGTAFDINWKQNQQGALPPLVGQPASVRELVPLANHFGFYWGGHFSGAYIDGMHFEVALLLK